MNGGHIVFVCLPTDDEDVVALVCPPRTTLGTTGRPGGGAPGHPRPDAANDGGEVRVEDRVAGEDVGVGERDDGSEARDVGEDLDEVAAAPSSKIIIVYYQSRPKSVERVYYYSTTVLQYSPLDAHPVLGGVGEAAVHPGRVLAHDAAVERLV